MYRTQLQEKFAEVVAKRNRREEADVSNRRRKKHWNIWSVFVDLNETALWLA